MALELGLNLNSAKCEVIGHTSDSGLLFSTRGIALPETDTKSTSMLGAPLFKGPHLDTALAINVQNSSGSHSA